MYYCEKCGAELPDIAMFCPKCGEAAPWNTPQMPDGDTGYQGYNDTPAINSSVRGNQLNDKQVMVEPLRGMPFCVKLILVFWYVWALLLLGVGIWYSVTMSNYYGGFSAYFSWLGAKQKFYIFFTGAMLFGVAVGIAVLAYMIQTRNHAFLKLYHCLAVTLDVLFVFCVFLEGRNLLIMTLEILTGEMMIFCAFAMITNFFCESIRFYQWMGSDQYIRNSLFTRNTSVWSGDR